jgi:cytochrome P450
MRPETIVAATVAEPKDFPRASLVEGIRFTAQVAVPNVVQGLFRRRRNAVAVAGRTGAEKLGVSFLRGLKRRYGEGPVWIRVANGNAVLVFGEAAIRRVLEGSPEPFASDPEPKKSAMAHFQPGALTISREPRWRPRRAFAEAVLDTNRPAHRLADRIAAVCAEEISRLPAALGWDDFNAAVRRVTRRVVLGDGAATDGELHDLLGRLMDKSNPPGRGDDALYQRYLLGLRSYVAEAPEGSLAALAVDAPDPGGDVAGQITHWLFALGDTLAINAYRCLAVLASQPQVCSRVREEIDAADLATAGGIGGLRLLDGCLHEAMRLWPTTPMLARETTVELDWDGVSVPAGTQFLIVNSFNHRDPDKQEFADYFAPDQWTQGAAREDWTLNHFSHGPQGCPGTELATFVGRALLAGILRDHDPDYSGGPSLTAGRPLPYSLDFFGLRFTLAPRA